MEKKVSFKQIIHQMIPQTDRCMKRKRKKCEILNVISICMITHKHTSRSTLSQTFTVESLQISLLMLAGLPPLLGLWCVEPSAPLGGGQRKWKRTQILEELRHTKMVEMASRTACHKSCHNSWLFSAGGAHDSSLFVILYNGFYYHFHRRIYSVKHFL